ncbi:MAG: SAM-dependent DNA methyltransferase [Acidobacteria bacterium]|nr:SAM-dependent DNA methyltransferase [Acidobacteriota bacterium]
MQKQKLPSSGVARELLRVKGQFWTPDWVAEAMAAYVLKGEVKEVFDPAVGAGAFFRAAKKIAAESGKPIALSGTELNLEVLQQARQSGLTESDLANVQRRDFVLQPPQQRFKAILANPPYIRHHRLSGEVKAQLKKYGALLIGEPLDGRAGLHIYFLLRALELLDDDGRLAFLMPADTCEGIFANRLWRWITQHYRLDAVITFSPAASPFPQVDTNPIIFLLRKSAPTPSFFWAKCNQAESSHLKEWMSSEFHRAASTELSVAARSLEEGLTTGLSRTPGAGKNLSPVLADFATVMRGIATGANEFFFLTAAQAKALDLPHEFLLPAIGRTRDVSEEWVTQETIKQLETVGRPTLLFSPDGRPLNAFPLPVATYLRQGEALNLHQKPLISTRRPWYKMETRNVPPILFAYLGRRHTRFIRNLAGVLPLTGFLCVYPHQKEADYIEKLWQVLRHPQTVANLSRIGKSYGAGAIKVEPRALEQLPLSDAVLAKIGFQPVAKPAQLSLY